MAAPGRRAAGAAVPGAALGAGPSQDLEMARVRGGGASVPVPRAPLLAEPLEDVEAPRLRRRGARVLVPLSFLPNG